MNTLTYPKPKAIFFDFDGVVLESGDIKTEAFLELFEEYPQHREAIRAYHLTHTGISRFKKFAWIYENLLGRKISDSESKSLGDRFSDIVFRKILETPFVPGVLDLIHIIHGRVLAFVASGTPEDELKIIVKKRGLESNFQEVCGSPSTKETIIDELLKKYNLAHGECWFIGDGNTDYQAAKEKQLHFIARSTPELETYWKGISGIYVANDLLPVYTYFKHADQA